MEHHDKTQSRRGEQNRDNQGGRGGSAIRRGGELTEEAVGQPDAQGDGISNRPLEEEQDGQDNLPPRGERRADRKED